MNPEQPKPQPAAALPVVDSGSQALAECVTAVHDLIAARGLLRA